MNMILVYYYASAHLVEIGYLHAIVILSMWICPCTKKKCTSLDTIMLYRVLKVLAIDQNLNGGLFMQTNV